MADGKKWRERRLEILDYEPSNAKINLTIRVISPK